MSCEEKKKRKKKILLLPLSNRCSDNVNLDLCAREESRKIVRVEFTSLVSERGVCRNNVVGFYIEGEERRGSGLRGRKTHDCLAGVWQTNVWGEKYNDQGVATHVSF